MDTTYDVIVVGGGASGMFCAAAASQRGYKVLLLEKMERVGRKMLISGKGRCNVTNDCTWQELLQQVKSNPKFLMSALSQFPPSSTMDFFEQLHIPLKVERGNRVFPQSDKSLDVVGALEHFLQRQGVRILCGAKVEEILCENGRVTGVVSTSGTFYAPNVAVATGGVSYPKTGSTGDGYTFAKALGHTVVPLSPGLIPIVLQGDTHKHLQGLSLRNVRLSLHKKGGKKSLFDQLGELLFTHFGISGPLVLKASFYMEADKLTEYEMALDLKPALSEKQLDQRIIRDFELFSNKEYQNALVKLLPKKLISVVVHQSGIAPDKKVNQITARERKSLGALLKAFPISPKAFRPIEEAIVTRGGVSVKEVNPSTMESKQTGGLYFCGEVLDVDAYTGGYNLQIAFATGHLAAQAMRKEKGEIHDSSGH